MKEKLAKLIDVKSIVTLTLAIVFAVLSLLGHISPEQFLTIFTVIIGFYFGTQVQKKQDETPTEDTAPNPDVFYQEELTEAKTTEDTGE